MKAHFEMNIVAQAAAAIRSGVGAPSTARCRVVACLMAAWWGFGAHGQEPTGSPLVDYSTFRIISERNIFNANRSGRPVIRTEESRHEPRVDSLTLVGTMSYEKGPFAFFDGTSSDYRKVLPPGGTIAGYKVATIAVNQVKLEAESNHVELAVGMQLRREDEGPWQLRERTESSFASSSSSHSDSGRSDYGRSDSGRPDFGRSDSRRSDYRRSSDYRGSDSRGSSSFTSGRPNPAPTASAPALSAEEESEILKKLMEQREKELK